MFRPGIEPMLKSSYVDPLINPPASQLNIQVYTS